MPNLHLIPPSDKIFITGMTGFIGSALARRLAPTHQVTGVARHPNGRMNLPTTTNLIPQDLTQTAVSPTHLSPNTVLFHAAALPSKEDPTGEKNLALTQSLFQSAEQGKIKRFIYLSSIAAYGAPTHITIDEEQEIDPTQKGIYGRSKARIEQYLQIASAQANIPLTIVRPALVYGPHSIAWSVRILSMLQKRTPLILGTGNGTTHPIFIDNLIDALILLASHPEAANRSFPLLDLSLSWHSFINYHAAFSHLSPKSLPLWYARLLHLIYPNQIPLDLLSFYTKKYRFHTPHLTKIIRHTPKIPIQTGMRITEDWLRESGYLPRIKQ